MSKEVTFIMLENKGTKYKTSEKNKTVYVVMKKKVKLHNVVAFKKNNFY